MNKVQFDFTDADLLMDVKLRDKKREFQCRILSIDKDFVYIHLCLLEIREVTYKQLQENFEYYNKTMRQWHNCEKVG